MKKITFLTIMLVYLLNVQAIDFKKIEEHVDKTPVSKTHDVKLLSDYLTHKFKRQDEKFAAIYFWIAKNIDYDVKNRYSNPVYKDIKEIIAEVMKSKKGVCQHYSELFHELSRLAGLTSFVVNGYGKEFGKVMNLAHAWNVVRVDGNYYLIDATWGAGHINPQGKYVRDFSLEYFMVKPKDFINDHISFDPMWQLLERPLFYEEFENGINYQRSRPKFHYADTIAHYSKQAKIQQVKSTIRRIEQNGKANALVKFELDFQKETLRILEYNKEVENFNKANLHYNTAVTQLNEFYELKRKKIHDNSISLKQLNDKLSEIETNLFKAKNLYKSTNAVNNALSGNLKKAQANVLKFEKIVKQQKTWLNGLAN